MSAQKHLRNLQILNLVLRGMKLGQIARQLNLHRNTIGKVLRKPETRQLLETMQKELVQQATTHMLERHKMIEHAAEAKHAHKRAQRHGHQPEDGYEPIEKYLAHRA